jgi:hypothetical protein
MNNPVKKPEALKENAIKIELANSFLRALKSAKGAVNNKSSKKDEKPGTNKNAHKKAPHTTKNVLRASSAILVFSIFHTVLLLTLYNICYTTLITES